MDIQLYKLSYKGIGSCPGAACGSESPDTGRPENITI